MYGNLNLKMTYPPVSMQPNIFGAFADSDGALAAEARRKGQERLQPSHRKTGRGEPRAGLGIKVPVGPFIDAVVDWEPRLLAIGALMAS